MTINDAMLKAATLITLALEGLSSATGAVFGLDDSPRALGTPFVPAGGIVDDTGTGSATEGDGVVARYTARRAAVVALDAGAGGLAKQDDVSTFVPGTDWALPFGGPVDDTATDTADEGDFAAARVSARRALKVSLDDQISGEDQTNNVMRVEGQFTGTSCTADTQVKASAGFVHTITVYCNDSAPTAGSIIIYDNTAESGTEIARFEITTTLFNPICITLDRICTTGIYVGFTTTADVRVQITWR